MSVLLTACASQPAPKRYAWITGLKPGKAARYEELRAHPRPAVNRMIKDCHIRNFSINERRIAGKLYLFACLESTGKEDLLAAAAATADTNRLDHVPETKAKHDRETGRLVTRQSEGGSCSNPPFVQWNEP